MSISGHKVYGPKGVGALYVNKNIKLIPIFDGGGQENDMRSGTLAVPLIAGLGEAAKIAQQDMRKDYDKISKLSDRLKAGLMKIDGAILNGDPEKRYKGCMNFSFKGIGGMRLVNALSDRVAISIGSACGSSHNVVDSYVIKSLGVSNDFVGAIRIGIGRFTTEEEVDYAIQEITKEIQKIRAERLLNRVN